MDYLTTNQATDHGFVLGLMVELAGMFEITSNRKADLAVMMLC